MGNKPAWWTPTPRSNNEVTIWTYSSRTSQRTHTCLNPRSSLFNLLRHLVTKREILFVSSAVTRSLRLRDSANLSQLSRLNVNMTHYCWVSFVYEFYYTGKLSVLIKWVTKLFRSEEVGCSIAIDALRTRRRGHTHHILIHDFLLIHDLSIEEFLVVLLFELSILRTNLVNEDVRAGHTTTSCLFHQIWCSRGTGRCSVWMM